MENGHQIGLDLDNLDRFFDRGVRVLTLTHDSDNDIGDSATDRVHPDDRGLSKFGRRVVERMNRLGMVIDLAHSSDKTFFDTIRLSHVRTIGIDHVGIGSDFDGGGYLGDCRDVSEYPNLTAELVRRGYSEADIRRIWAGNYLRVLRRVEEAATLSRQPPGPSTASAVSNRP